MEFLRILHLISVRIRIQFCLGQNMNLFFKLGSCDSVVPPLGYGQHSLRNGDISFHNWPNTINRCTLFLSLSRELTECLGLQFCRGIRRSAIVHLFVRWSACFSSMCVPGILSPSTTGVPRVALPVIATLTVPLKVPTWILTFVVLNNLGFCPIGPDVDWIFLGSIS